MDGLKRPTGAQRNDGHRRRLTLRVLADIVEARQCPADRSVAATDENFEVWNIAENIEAATKKEICRQMACRN